MSSEKKFDVFLSHNSKDKPWAIKLKGSLQAQGIKVWLDKDEIRPGDLFAKALEKGIEESRAVALIISPEAMNSGWVEAEYYRALSLATNKELQLIPVLYRQAQIPGFLKDRNWVDFSNGKKYAENIRNLLWGITGDKQGIKPDPAGNEPRLKPSTGRTQPPGKTAHFVRQIKNPFVRDLERKLRMGNAHWIQAGFPMPDSELNFTSVYYQNQIEVFDRLQTTTRAISTDIANQNTNLLQDSFLDMVEENLNQLTLRVKQVEELMALSKREFELSLALRKAGKVILRDAESVRKLALRAPMKLLSSPSEYDQISDDLSTEIGSLAISIEEYQKHLTAILKQAKLEKIYSS